MSLDMEYRHQLDSLEASSLYVQPCGLEAWKRAVKPLVLWYWFRTLKGNWCESSFLFVGHRQSPRARKAFKDFCASKTSYWSPASHEPRFSKLGLSGESQGGVGIKFHISWLIMRCFCGWRSEGHWFGRMWLRFRIIARCELSQFAFFCSISQVRKDSGQAGLCQYLCTKDSKALKWISEKRKRRRPTASPWLW